VSGARWLARLRPDPYILAILAMVAVASLFPARGPVADGLSLVSKVLIGLLFFFHGAKLSREAVIAGLAHWRLHVTVLAATFALFPLLGLAVQLLPSAVLPASLAAGVLFLACLPSTVQSSIAFTAIARGNVAAAVCAASASNLFGIFITPALVALLMHVRGGGTAVTLSAVQAIAVQLLLPFAAGQIASPWLAGFVRRFARPLSLYDRGTILVVVYSAFSAAVVEGVWRQVSPWQLLWLALVCCALLAVVLAVTAYGARAAGFAKDDEITIVFCGSKKSLASGAPMATIFFPSASVGLMILPLMLFHQIQLMACALIAQRYASRPASEETLVPS
jgi:sodium/bile acid cotransporter 7